MFCFSCFCCIFFLYICSADVVLLLEFRDLNVNKVSQSIGLMVPNKQQHILAYKSVLGLQVPCMCFMSTTYETLCLTFTFASQKVFKAQASLFFQEK